MALHARALMALHARAFAVPASHGFAGDGRAEEARASRLVDALVVRSEEGGAEDEGGVGGR
eukprot:5939069-Pleurochrysis_carterae.AAC.1